MFQTPQWKLHNVIGDPFDLVRFGYVLVIQLCNNGPCVVIIKALADDTRTALWSPTGILRGSQWNDTVSTWIGHCEGGTNRHAEKTKPRRKHAALQRSSGSRVPAPHCWLPWRMAVPHRLFHQHCIHQQRWSQTLPSAFQYCLGLRGYF